MRKGGGVLKARIAPHGNHESDKEDIGKDSSTSQLFVIRLLMSLVPFLGFKIGMADIKGAYLQSGPIRRVLYVRPPREWNEPRGVLWRLTKLPYGVVEAGRQCKKVVEEWMLDDGGLNNVFGISQLFVKRNDAGWIILLVADVPDDFIMGETRGEIEGLVTRI